MQNHLLVFEIMCKIYPVILLITNAKREVLTVLNITDVRVRLVKKEDSKLKAVASITIDNSFVVHEIRVIEGANGCFVAMPSRKTPEGEFKDTAHPIDTPTREFVDKTVLDAYEKALKEAPENAQE